MKKFIFILSLLMTGPALADMERAHKAHEDGEYRIAFGEYLTDAKAGNTEAMVMVGLYYAQGLYVLQDHEKSHEWMLKAANLGERTAQRNMGVGYQAGVGNLDKDPREAFKWFILAANQDEVNSQLEVAVAYNFGVGVARDMEQALIWYQKAAEAGDPRAQYNLAGLYGEGNGVTKDSKTAAHWLEKSAEQNYHEALYTLGVINHQGMDAPQNYDAAAGYFRRAFIAGKSEAAAYLAEYAYLGIASDADPITAYMWVKLGTEITSTMPGGQLSQDSFDRLQQNRSFLESTLTDNQKSEAQKRMDEFTKEILE